MYRLFNVLIMYLVIFLVLLGNASSKVNTSSLLKVVTILEAPYTMLGNHFLVDGSHSGKLVGYIPDMMAEIARRTGVKYTMHLVHDGKYGGRVKWGGNFTERWTGMVGEIGYGRADIAAAGLVVTAARNGHIEFTKPFMHVGITGLYQVPPTNIIQVTHHNNIFMVFLPFSKEVWITILSTYILVSVTMSVINRTDPYEWHQYKLNTGEDDKTEHGQWLGLGLQGSLWLILSAFNKQGYEHSPHSIAGRVLLGCWWLYCSFTLVVYTGSFIQLLPHMDNKVVPLLSNQAYSPPLSMDTLHLSNYRFGTIRNSGIHKSFCNSKVEKYQEMCRQMEMDDTLVEQTSHGLHRVREGSYVFLMDFAQASFLASQDCSLSVLNGNFNLKSFAMAVHPSNVTLRRMVDKEILKMHEDEFLLKLFNKWFKSDGICDHIVPDKDILRDLGMESATNHDQNVQHTEDMAIDHPFSPISIRLFSSILAIMVGGMALSILCLIAEIVYFKVYAGRRRNNMQDTSLIYATRLEETIQ